MIRRELIESVGPREGASAFVAGFVVTRVAGPLREGLQFLVAQRFTAHLTGRIMGGILAIPGLAPFEDPKTRDLLEVAKWAVTQPANNLAQITLVATSVAASVGWFSLSAVNGAWIPGLVLATSAVAAILHVRIVKTEGMAQMGNTLHARRNRYYSGLALDTNAAKEVRVFGLAGWILGRQEESWLHAVADTWRARRRNGLIASGLGVLGYVAAGVGYLSLVRAAASGLLEVGRFAAASLAIVALVSSLNNVGANLAYIRRDAAYLPQAFRILALGEAPRTHVPPGPPVSSGGGPAIVFDGVTFIYPGTSRVVLDRLDLAVEPGEVLALVGENGAGKTTLLKLLCRFYEPDAGRILLDGVDVRDRDVVALRARMAVIFQDFLRYTLPARDNVGFGAPDRLDDTGLLEDAARAAGALDLVTGLPDGWDTPLSRQFGGVDLSGGEWQRIALARAMASRLGRGADVLVLDEPTASLDVRVEHELYGRFAQITSGATTILVSHRFSTVRMAHRIAVLDAGRVAEIGSRDELLSAGAVYAGLYTAQARHFVQEPS